MRYTPENKKGNLMDWLDSIRTYKQEYRTHALERMFKRKINFLDIEEVIKNLEIIEEYPTDSPYPSCLALGYNKLKRPIHIVYSVNSLENVIYIITVYEPDIEKWESSFKRRKV